MDLAAILPFVLIALVFWLLIVRPQRKRQQELRSTQSTLGIGTEVMLGSGIYGTVASLDEETLQLELSPGTHVKVARQAVVRIITPVEHEAGLDTGSDTGSDTGLDPGHGTGGDPVESQRRDDEDGRPGSSGPHQ